MTQPQVTPRMKPEPISCPCGCGAIGQPRVKNWRDGSSCNRNCKGCHRCRGLRSNRKGKRGQARAATFLGVPRSPLRPGHEEHMGGPVRFEHKAGARDAGPVFTRFDASKAQSDEARSMGDNRPFVASYSKGKRVLFVFEAEDGPQVVAGLAEAFGMVP